MLTDVCTKLEESILVGEAQVGFFCQSLRGGWKKVVEVTEVSRKFSW